MLRSTLARLDERLLGSRLRGLYWRGKDLLWNARWLAGGRRFVRRRIEWERLAQAVPASLHGEIARSIRGSLRGTDNVAYFTRLRVYGASDWALHGADHPFELFPPNLAALDFLLGANLPRAETVVLDFGCGTGHLVVYLRRMGFIRSVGYDDFSQLGQATARACLGSFGMADALLDPEGLARCQPHAVIVGSLPWTAYAAGIQPVLAKPSLRHVLLDAYYPCPETLPGFRRIAEYRRLLRVFERC